MKTIKLIAAIVLFPALCLAQTSFEGFLSGEQEVPTVLSQGYGIIEAELNGNTLVLEGAFENLSSPVDTSIAGGIHIHAGMAGENGSVILPLTAIFNSSGTAGVFDGSDNTFQLSSGELQSLQNRELYVNIHTEKFPSGELRAQILPSSDQHFQASLSGNQEVPAVLTAGGGILMMELNGNQLTMSGSFSGLNSPFDPEIAMGAHIHSGMPGENGGIEVILDATVDPDGLGGYFFAANNTFTLDSAIVQLLVNRQLYVNIHTEDFQAGEIRGQITGLASSVWRSHLSGANERPAVDSRARGSVIAEFDAWQQTVSLYGSFSDLESPVAVDIAGGAHIHLGFAGQNGPVVWPLEIDLSSPDNVSGFFHPSANTLSLDQEEVEMLYGRMFYINIHSVENSAGELRGQLLPLANYHFNSYAGGSQEVPSVVSGGSGGLKVEWTPGKIVVSGSFDNLQSPLDESIAGGAHLHAGLPGQNGEILLILNPSPGADLLSGEFRAENNTFQIDSDLESAIAGRSTYLNIHTEDFPAGEIRGQVLREAQAYYQANLSGSQEVPAVLTSGRGLVLMERSGSEIIPVGSFDNLSSDFDEDIAGGAHIHEGFAGQNGGISTPLSPITDANLLGGQFDGSETIEFDTGFWERLQRRSLYVNIHTKSFAAGEIRGQITGLNSSLFRAHLAGVNEVPAVETRGRGVVLAELDNGGNIRLSGSYENLESPLAEDIAGGVHLHLGMAGQNGAVAIALNPEVQSNTSGVFSAVDNTFDPGENALEQLINRAMYVNVHSEDYRAGEIRGQLVGDAQYVFTALLSGPQQVPAVVSPGYGMLKGEWNNGQITFSGSASNLLDELATHIAGGVHLHLGLPGENGGVAIALNASQLQNNLDLYDIGINPLENRFEIGETEEEFIANRETYINLHTLTYEDGELRGQVLREALGYYYSNLFGSHEFPSVSSTGMGAVQLEWYGDRAEVIGSFHNLRSEVDTSIAGGVHIHMGLPGENGPVLEILRPELDAERTGGVFSVAENSIETDEDFTDMLRERRLYINVHSVELPAGEIRGPVSGPSTGIMRAYLRGAEENPQVISRGGGSVIAELNPDFSANYYGSFRDLGSDLAVDIAGGIHLHSGLPGQNGPVLVPFENNSSANSRSGEISNQRLSLDTLDFLSKISRSTYVNIHTEAFAPGEIRGQFLGESQDVFTGIFSGLQEVNPVLTLANGTVFAEKSADRLIVSGGLFDMVGTVDRDIAGGAHLHMGFPGQNGDVVLLLSLSESGGSDYYFSPSDNILEVTPEVAELLSNRQIYANIHTDLYPGGEARAQMMGEANNYYIANLSGSHEVPPVRTDGSGTVLFEQNASGLWAVGAFDGLQSEIDTDIAGGAHVHSGLTGENGPVEAVLTATPDSDGKSGIFGITENALIVSDSLLRDRKLYVNIHSVDNQAGELRGTLIPVQTGAFTTQLDGRNEVPPLLTNARGQALVEYNGNEITVSGTFSNLSSPLETDIAGGAHIHTGASDENGGIVFVLEVDPTAADLTSGEFPAGKNVFEASESADLMRLMDGLLYINIHSVEQPAGEIRGQLQPVINFFPEEGPEVLSPFDGELIVVEGLPETQLDISWTDIPSDGNQPYIYHWQLSLDPDFEENLIYLNTGTANSIALTFGDIDWLLDENGVMIGQTVNLYHRAVTSDGSLRTPGEVNSVDLTRGVVTNTGDLSEYGNSLHLFPNPLKTGVNPTVEIYSDSDRRVKVQVSNASGQLLKQEDWELSSGLNTIQPHFDLYQSGVYFIRLIDGENHSLIRRISVVD